MKIGVPKEIKNNENRVGITPAGVSVLVNADHEVFIEVDAGLGSGITNEEFIAAGAKIVDTAEEAWSQKMVIKVKEPLPSEYNFFREDLILFTYLHLAAEPELTKALIESKCKAIAYETVQVGNSLPLLRPMSEVAGRRGTIVAATHLEKHRGGRGVLLSGVPGVARGNVVVIGGGVAGISAARMAIGLGANVTIIELNEDRMRYLEDIFDKEVTVLKSNPLNIAESLKTADAVISTILIPGAKANKIVTEEMVKNMPEGSVIVDISIDQGGSVETIDRVTTHDDPVYVKHGVIHYSVANMPGATPRTSTFALTNATIPYALDIANQGYRIACLDSEPLLKGLNVLGGHVVYKAVADAFGYDYVDPKEVLLKHQD
ncbi:alanine dehydrogenase [Liberiplasma polymorphum]|uniref:alanine dehydrogenase n=1 Tax=Liberiplasma polymorphum TaxID=3374570 RepID=UPI003771074B